MWIGTTVKIGHARCEITALPPVDSSAAGCDAFISLSHRLIRIGDDLPSTTRAEHLMHELVHGIRRVWGIVLPDDQAEERIVNQLTHGLCCLFADNPLLMIELVEVLSGKEAR